MTVTARTIRFAIAHPVKSWRFVKACRAPWPLMSVVEAETIAADEARRVRLKNHPSMRGQQ